MSPATPAARAARSLRAAVATAAAAAATLAAAVAGAQECHPPSSSNEAKLLAFFSVPLAFSPVAAPERMRPGALRIAFEVAPVPEPPNGIQRTSMCYVGAVQKSRLAPVLPRPRVSVGLPAGFAIEGSYLPPVTVADATPNLASLALSFARDVDVGGSSDSTGAADGARAGAGRGAVVTLLLRTQGTFGSVRGPITCPTSALQRSDPGAPCYGTTPSRDTFHPNMVGIEGAAGAHRAGGRLGVYAGGGVTFLEPRFRVGFRDGNGALDQTRILVSLTRGSVFGGATYHVAPVIDLAAQVYAFPADATTWRVSAGYRLR